MTTDPGIALRQLDVPECDTGAPTPIVLADDTRLAFGYRLPSSAASRNAIFRVDPLILKFGYPNDEALPGHRYDRLGLGYYNAYEIVGSEWIAEIKAANRVRFPDSDFLFADYRHFIFTFHDSTLEFVTADMPRAELTDGDLWAALQIAFRR